MYLPSPRVAKFRILDPNIYPLKMDGSEDQISFVSMVPFKGIWLSGYGTWFGDMLIC